MNACLRDSQVLQLVFGVTLETELEEVMEHLDACPACRARVESERAQHSDAQKLSPDVQSTTSRSGSGAPRTSSSEMFPVVDGYEILSRIHAGAQGIVYKAVQLSTSRTVAVKLLPHEQSATDRQKHRFEREVGLSASLRHPNIVTVYDSGLTSGRYFFAMEYIHGKPLDQFLKSANLSVADKLRLFATICSAVSYAHQKGVIHRDLKPGNILVDAAAQPHVVDFGLAKSAGVLAMHGEAPFTLTSQFMGTLAYASPEQTKGDPTLIDTRSDVYALGVILFEMLTGAYPYPMSTDLAKMFHTICHMPPKPPSSVASGINHDIDTIVLRALAKEPERRYQTVADFQADVERWLFGEPISAHRDSAFYLIRVRARALINRHKVIASIATVILATAIVAFPRPLYERIWNEPIRWYENWAISSFSPAIVGSVFENVRIVAVNDETIDVLDKMSRNAQVSDVTPDNLQSFRRLYSRFMERLAETDVRVVLFDISFGQAVETADHSFAADLVGGIEALREKGIEPIFAIDPGKAIEDQLAEELIAARVELGAITMQQDTAQGPKPVWRGTDLAVICNGPTYLGLALAGVAQMRLRQLDLNPTVDNIESSIDHRQPAVRIEYKKGGKGARPTAGPADEYPLQRLVEVEECLAGVYQPAVPSPEQIQEATLDFHDLFMMERDQLNAQVKGKLLIIGNRRQSAQDRFVTPEGIEIFGVDLHAVTADALLRSGPSYFYIGRNLYWAALGLASVLGLLCASPRLCGLLRRTGAIAVSLIAIFTVSAVLFNKLGCLLNPILPALALLLALLGGMILFHGQSGSHFSTLSRRSQP